MKRSISDIMKDIENDKRMQRAAKFRIISLLLSIVIAFTYFLSIFIPQINIIPDMVKVGFDYITLDINHEAFSTRDMNTELNKLEDVHPFILADKSAFDKVKMQAENGFSDEYSKKLYESVLANAEALLNKKNFPVMEYVLDEEDSILPISRECINRVIILGFAYNVTGEEKYAARAKEEILNVCSYEDWCPSHFLATAEMALAVSIFYDWFYDYLTEDERVLLRDTTWEYAITPALSKNYLKNWFTWSKNNWNSICYSGIGIAAMTFYAKDSYKAAEFLNMCHKGMPIAFSSFTPDGVYAEGPGYCQSGMNSIVYFIATSRNLFGTDFGMSEIDGVRQLGSFPVYITGTAGMFNFGDNKDRMCYSPVLHWYASEFDNPLLSLYQKNDMPDTFTPDLSENTERNGSGKEDALSLLWYDSDMAGDNADFSTVPLAMHLKSDMGQDIVVMRSAYNDPNATFAAIKGGYNYINHGDLDTGTFVFDALGERWAEELGPGAYDAPGYFMGLPFGGRWKNYCKRAEGQNTLVINPDASPEDQYALGRAEVFSFSETSDGAETLLNLTDAYAMQKVRMVTRRFELYDNRTSLRISDEILCDGYSEIYWFMHTKADISISEDGKTATLTKNGKQVKATLETDGIFTVMNAEKLSGAYEYDDEYKDIRKLTVHLTDVRDSKITVTLVPVKE